MNAETNTYFWQCRHWGYKACTYTLRMFLDWHIKDANETELNLGEIAS